MKLAKRSRNQQGFSTFFAGLGPQEAAFPGLCPSSNHRTSLSLDGSENVKLRCGSRCVLCISGSSGNETSVPQLCWLSQPFWGVNCFKSPGTPESPLVVRMPWMQPHEVCHILNSCFPVTLHGNSYKSCNNDLQTTANMYSRWIFTSQKATNQNLGGGYRSKTTAALSYEFQNSSPSGAKVMTRPHQDDVWDQLFSRCPKGRRNRPKNHPMSSVEWQPSPITVQGKKHGRPSAQRTFWKSQTQKIWTGLTLPTCNIQRRSSPVAPGCTLGQSIHPHFKGWQIMSNQ